ncbi:N-6 DNA methylase [Streptomyces filamentosus]|uniref:N-6 DNA methylase n=2 Tax=Streptomyces filamentosus TaxID=67294 RepID=A0ABY4UXZ8_STRFL|nr:N-6 DNA methylase [Streptomyces filamentosus]EFE75121.1 type II restriction-modification system DNA adenine-specific methylase [Streptomyces filamentosus NRRL 15998]MYR79201.1 N-6 DNA methylase [Streptomyces sp. SID5466]USC49210.1 N-6 DNA methylase [Streptomyces filamentosus]
MPENATEVTAAGIARLAGVGRAAVSNWRRRYADFPQPVGGTGTSPSFALSEVEQWLRDQGKLAEVPLRERVWQEVAGHPAGAGQALIHVGCALLLVRDRPTAWLELAAAPDERMAALLPQALGHVLTARFGPEADRGHGPGASNPARVHATSAQGPGGVHGASPPNPTGVHTPGASGPGSVRPPTAQDLLPSVPLLRAAAELAAGIGAGQAFEFLLGRQLDANPRQYTLTPPQLAELMADLAEPPKGADRAARERPVRSVLDPAAGTGALLRAVGGPATLYAQEADPGLAALTALRLALAAEGPRRAADGTHRAAPGPVVRTGDTLRADAFPELAADTVLCHPPFNERNWGHDELAYDPRWEYGLPARTESELAWVQHVLARLRDGGTAVLLMPPAAASRRSGRRIRAGLLRRGALRAVIALPAGAAPPYGVPLHLWILCKPEPGVRPVADLLLADTADLPGPAEDTSTGPGRPPGGKATGGKTPGGGRERFDWPAVRAAVLDAWRDRTDAEGVSRVVPVIELLDDDVDLAPARHLPRPASEGGASGLGEVRERLTETLRLTAGLVPPAAAPAAPAHRPLTTVGELARTGALFLHTGTAVPGSAAAPVLTEHDVLTGAAPTALASTEREAPGGGADDPVLLEPGDVVVPVLGGSTAARVVDASTAGAVLGRNLQLLRPDPAAVDPWFLAGFLRGTANHRQASSYASTAARLDARRLQLPRMPLAEQRRYGERFRELAAFEDALRTAGRLGGQLVQGMYDGLTDGTVTPG